MDRDDPEIAAVILNARCGQPYQCKASHAGVLAGKFTKLAIDVLNFEFGYHIDDSYSRVSKDDKERIRDNIRIPFYQWLYGDMDYGHWKRTTRITTGTCLTTGEVNALINFVETDAGYEKLAQWIDEHAHIYRMEKLP